MWRRWMDVGMLDGWMDGWGGNMKQLVLSIAPVKWGKWLGNGFIFCWGNWKGLYWGGG